MRHSRMLAAALASMAWLPHSGRAETAAPLVSNSVYQEPVVAAARSGQIQLVQDLAPVQSQDETELFQTTASRRYELGLFPTDSAGGLSFDSETTTEQVDEGDDPPPQDVGGNSLSGATPISMSSIDTASALKESSSTPTVSAQRRSPISFDPHVRGYHFGQIYAQADGQLWAPVRSDLDTMLSKLTPSMFQNANVIAGPYGVRYGPGFAFLDIKTLDTPRYECGYESHFGIASHYRNNGDQIYGTTSMIGGSRNWGYRFNYGNRVGEDYRSGNGTRVPSSYEAQTVLGQIGFDLTDYSRVEFRYLHLDQNDTEYALQFFDVDYLGTNSYSIHYVNENPQASWTRLRVESWHNETEFHGDNDDPGKVPIRGRLEASLLGGVNTSALRGVTAGTRDLFGTRGVFTFGDDDYVQLRTGADIRYEDHNITERFDLYDANGNPTTDPNFPIQTELPTSWTIDPGLFAELILPTRPYFTLSLGSRVDFVTTDARVQELGPNSNLGTNLQPGDLERDDVLYAFYATGDLELTSLWSTRFGFGHAQRAPSLIERYSDGVFLGLIQNGLSRYIGRPDLNKERLWQLDWSISHDDENFRSRVSFFHSWVLDFITYEDNPVTAPQTARVLRTFNTDLATLTGFEFYAEGDVTTMLTAFGTMAYVRGEDEDIDQPLWGIAPFEGTLGMRLHDPMGGQLWGLELSTRMVNGQERNAFVRRAGAPTVVDAIEDETPGFTLVNVRGYWNYSENLTFVTGVDNLFDNNYIEHLDLRLPGETIPNAVGTNNPQTFGPQFAFSPGTNLYFGFEWSR